MNKKLWFPITVFLLGFIILILPDAGAPVIRVNEKHGPSWLDVAGLILMFIGWGALLYGIVVHWKIIIETFGNTIAQLLIALYCISILGILMALQVRIEWILWMSISIASIINIAFVLVVAQKRKSPQ